MFAPWYAKPPSHLTGSGGRIMNKKIIQKLMNSLFINMFVTLNSFSSYELDFSRELHDFRIYTAIILRLSSSTRSSSYADLRQKSIGKSQGFHMQLYSNLSNHTEDVSLRPLKISHLHHCHWLRLFCPLIQLSVRQPQLHYIVQ